MMLIVTPATRMRGRPAVKRDEVNLARIADRRAHRDIRENASTTELLAAESSVRRSPDSEHQYT